VRGLPHVKELVERHKHDPFAFLGIVTDADVDGYRRRAAEAGVTWRNAWAGGPSGTWPAAWGVQRYPTIYVLDGDGRVRHVDLRGDALAAAVRALIAEQRARAVPKNPTEIPAPRTPH
jgi:hypothetical protein